MASIWSSTWGYWGGGEMRGPLGSYYAAIDCYVFYIRPTKYTLFIYIFMSVYIRFILCIYLYIYMYDLQNMRYLCLYSAFCDKNMFVEYSNFYNVLNIFLLLCFLWKEYMRAISCLFAKENVYTLYLFSKGIYVYIKNNIYVYKAL